MIPRLHILIGIDTDTIISGARAVEKALVDEIEKQGLTNEVKVMETGSLGLIEKGVVMVVYPDGIYYVNVKVEDVPVIVKDHLLKGRPVKNLMISKILPEKGVITKKDESGLLKKQNRIVLNNCGIINPDSIDEYIAADGYAALEKALLQMKPQDVIEEITKSELRGRGGAGFPTGLKWKFAREAKGNTKYIICNADEGEPGTFKDRLILEGDPHKLIEGMIIAGYAVGATKGFVYIRGEYQLSIDRLNKAIQQAKEYELLGENILDSGFSYTIEIKKGAGAYVCGEETALIESLEGFRGHPRIKPPYPVTEGLWKNPTVVNNVETLANIAPIIKNGASWFTTFGTPKNRGTKVYTILGDVVYPGLIEVTMGTTLREIVFSYAGGIREGKQFKAALVGGSAGAFLGPEMLDMPLDLDSLRKEGRVLGSGAILVMNETADIVEMLHSLTTFFKHESCGHCSPCRIGTARLYELTKDLKNGKALKNDLDLMLKLSDTMRETSFCPLGQSLLLPISTALKYFNKEIEKRIA